MGYTHYWSFNAPSAANVDAETAERLYQQAIKECRKVVRTLRENGLRLSGHTANSTQVYGGIYLNGAEEDAHEDFVLREHFNQNEPNFCKTARKPYDIAVTACLAILKYRLGNLITVSSDGRDWEWTPGITAARTILKRNVEVPFDAKPRGLRLVKAS